MSISILRVGDFTQTPGLAALARWLARLPTNHRSGRPRLAVPIPLLPPLLPCTGAMSLTSSGLAC